MKEKLIELLAEGEEKIRLGLREMNGKAILKRDAFGWFADHLLANGVTAQKSFCPYCGNDEGGVGRLKHSYDDSDGMEMSIHPSPKKENGYQSKAWWATVYFRGESRDFYIEACPFCGRRLVPFREEAEAALRKEDV